MIITWLMRHSGSEESEFCFRVLDPASNQCLGSSAASAAETEGRLSRHNKPAASPPNKMLSTTEEDLPTTLLSLLVVWMSLTVLRPMTVHSKQRMSLYRVSVRNAV